MNAKSSVHFLNRDLSYYLFFYQRRICMKMDTEPAVMGIESSCDDTGAAIVYANGKISAEHLISQHNTVLRHGGIMPLIAKHLHKSHIHSVVEHTLHEANMSVNDLNAIAVTVKPGLAMSLLVGLEYAKELCRRYKKPLVPIHHMEAHALTVRLFTKNVKFPYLACLISGGHCLLAIVHSIDKFSLLGQSIDDSPGEVFDKVARRLKVHNLPKYANSSGGAVVEDLARNGNPFAFEFTTPLQHYRNCNFSFSGLKSQAMRYIETEELKFDIEADGIIPSASDLCASFQWSVTKHLCWRLQRSMEFIKLNNLLKRENLSLAVSGGAACNKYILKAFELICHEYGYTVCVPPPKYCTDNGAMIAWNGLERYLNNAGIYEHDKIDDIRVEPKCQLGENMCASVEKANIKCSWIKVAEKLHPNFNSGQFYIS